MNKLPVTTKIYEIIRDEKLNFIRLEEIKNKVYGKYMTLDGSYEQIMTYNIFEGVDENGEDIYRYFYKDQLLFSYIVD